MWHFIAYIDVDAERLLAQEMTTERDRMIEKTKKDKNQQAEDAENEPEDDFEDVRFFFNSIDF